MKNLLLMQRSSFNVQQNCPNGVQHLTIDALSGLTFVSDDNCVVGFNPDSKQPVHKFSLSESGLSIGESKQRIVSLTSEDEVGELCIATSAGDLLLWNAKSGHSEQLGMVEQGIAALKWSPDQEMMVLVTGSDTLILMTREFDPILEVPIHTEEFGDEPVNVGWGKKETQFHGSQGKPQQEDLKAKDRGQVLPWDDLRPRISWRGDGQFFAISAVERHSKCRKIRVWSREGQLMSTNEAMLGLEQAVNWRPSGNLIAATQRKPNKHDVVFFEKNGLCHGSFTLPFAANEMKVIELKWNRDSDVLGVWLEKQMSDKDIPVSYIQLWTANNYHWYLKQELQHGSTGTGNVTAFEWDPETSLKMHVACQSGHVIQYVWTYAIHSSYGNSASNKSTVTVIDGDKLLLTPFLSMVVPPPLCGSTVSLGSPVLQVAVGRAPHCDDLAVTLSDNSLVVIKQATSSTQEANTVLLGAGNWSNIRDWRHLLWLDKSCLVAIDNTNSFIEMPLVVSSDGISATQRYCTNFDGVVIRACPSSNNNCVVFEDKTGRVFYYRSFGANQLPEITPFSIDDGHLQLPSVCSSITTTESAGKECVIGLTDFFSLFVNATKVANNCTSYSLHKDYLILTTHQHNCRCVNIKKLAGITPLTNENDQTESIRRIERGGRIITAVINDTKVILQMPRGNLETIHPRTLVVENLKHLFDKLAYGKAFAIMRKHRINTNLMMDHNRNLFLENVDMFVKKANSADDINLFLADLSDEDVTATLYAPFYATSCKDSQEQRTSKVDQACHAVRNALVAVDAERYLHSILTTYAKQTPPDLETVLRKIKELRDNQTTPGDGKHSVADKALKYILYLIDVDNLYDVALGMYDFDVVIMVASFSHKDPKEYLPFLNHLKTLEPNYQRYTIDCHLKRNEKALQHISNCGDAKFDECLGFIEKHKLHTAAMKLYNEETSQFKAVSKSYGNYLASKKHHNEAGIVFWRCGFYHDAMEAFVACGDWSAAMCQAKLLRLNDKDTISLVKRLVEKLTSTRHHVDAAYLLETYCMDVELAAVTLIEGRKWPEAIYLLHKHIRVDIFETHLKPALVEEHNRLLTSVRESHAKFRQYEARLEVVRKQKEAEVMNYQDGEDFQAADGIYSEASSVTGQSMTSQGSRSSRSSGHSSKSRRKVQRKKYSLKEGSRNEEFALMEALAEITNTCHEQQNEVSFLLSALLLFKFDDKCEEIQHCFHDYTKTVEAGLQRIWLPRTTTSSSQVVTGPDTSVNQLIAQLRQMRTTEMESELPPQTQPRFLPQTWYLNQFK